MSSRKSFIKEIGITGLAMTSLPATVTYGKHFNAEKKEETGRGTFIDCFIAVPAKITKSGHQIEIRMYEHFTKPTSKGLTGLSGWHIN